jgi:hypothetical protein
MFGAHERGSLSRSDPDARCRRLKMVLTIRCSILFSIWLSGETANVPLYSAAVAGMFFE